MEKHRVILPISLFIAILAVSTASIFIRFAQADAPSLVIAALRLTFATLLLAPLALARHRVELQGLKRADLILAMVSGLFLAIHFATWITSLEYTSVASSVVFVATGPLWVALLSPMLLNEKLGRAAIVGLIIALLGGTIIGLSDACVIQNGLHCPELSHIMEGRAMWGNFLALTGAWAITGYLPIYFCGVWHGSGDVDCHYVWGRRVAARVSTQNLRLDLPARGGATTHRAFDLQLGVGIFTRRVRGSDDTRRASGLSYFGVFPFERDPHSGDDLRWYIDIDRHLSRIEEQ